MVSESRGRSVGTRDFYLAAIVAEEVTMWLVKKPAAIAAAPKAVRDRQASDIIT
jgi:hypothetical protein